jgi:transcriptional regulator with XRE-family HTH domain
MVRHENNLAGTAGEAEPGTAAQQGTALVLERWRQQARISRQRLSELADVSATYVRTIEAGVDDLRRPVVPSPAIMLKLAHGLALALGDGPGYGATLDVASGDSAVLARGVGRDQVERTIYAELMGAAGYLAPTPEGVADPLASPPMSSAPPIAAARGVVREALPVVYARPSGVPRATVALHDARLLEHARDLLEHWDTVSADDQTLILGVMALIHDRWARTQVS